MKNFKAYLFISLLVLVQASIVPNIRFYNYYPNLILAFLLSYLVTKDDQRALIWVIFGGLLLDIFSNVFFGFYALQFIIFFLMYRYIVRPIIHDPSILTVCVILLIFGLMSGIYQMVALKLPIFSYLPIIAILQSIVSLFIYITISRLKRDKSQVIL